MIKISARLFINVPCTRFGTIFIPMRVNTFALGILFRLCSERESTGGYLLVVQPNNKKHIFKHCFCLFPDFHQHNTGSMYFHLKLRLSLIQTLDVTLFDVALEIPVSKPVHKKCHLRWMYYHGVISGVDGSRGG